MLRASFEDLREEMVVDLFAGGGGASTGIERALRRSPDIAINHSPEAIAMHEANHPATRHFREDVWKVPPREVCGSRRVGLLWMSPDCTHHSRAKGKKPLDKKRRALAYAGIRWAREVRPRVIFGENVQEFEDWGGLDDLDRPDPAKKGKSFLAWVAKLRSYGYEVQWRVLVAADHGAATTRERLYFVARCDGQPIVWPEPSHGPGRAAAWLPASSIIRWDILGRSIFDRDKPLVEASLRRIAVGLERYVLGATDPFIVKYYGTGAVADVADPLDTITSRDRFGLVAPFIIRHGHYSTITGAGLREGCGAGTFRGQRATDPVATICATNDKHLVAPYLIPVRTTTAANRGELALVAAAFVAKGYGGPNGHATPGTSAHSPLSTITAQDHNHLAAAWITKYYGTSTGSDARAPFPTVTANGRGGGHLAEVRALLRRYGRETGKAQGTLFEAEPGLLTLGGEVYQVADVTLRMFEPGELFAAQGFPSSYIIRPDFGGKPMTKTAQIELCGNSVCPPIAEAIVAANTRAPAWRATA